MHHTSRGVTRNAAVDFTDPIAGAGALRVARDAVMPEFAEYLEGKIGAIAALARGL